MDRTGVHFIKCSEPNTERQVQPDFTHVKPETVNPTIMFRVPRWIDQGRKGFNYYKHTLSIKRKTILRTLNFHILHGTFRSKSLAKSYRGFVNMLGMNVNIHSQCATDWPVSW